MFRKSSDSPLTIWLLAFALIAAVFAAYSNTWQAPMILDDEATIIWNPTVVNLADSWRPPLKSGLTSGGRPLVNISLALNYHFAGDEVRPYHVTNAALHALAALVLFGLVRQTLLLPRGVRWAGTAGATPVAWLAAALWALHPLQTESVTYIVQRAETIAGLCVLLALYCFARHAMGGGRGWLIAAWVACLSGMASKEICAAIPLLVFFYDRTFFAGTFSEAWRKRSRFYLGMAATWLLLGFLVWGGQGRDGTVGFGSEIAWYEYLQTQAWAIVRYLRVSVWPVGLIFDYGIFVERDWVVIATCGSLVLALVAFTVIALRRWPAAGFLGFLFFAILGPTSSVIPVITQTMAEHRMYLPVLAIVLLFTATVVHWGRQWAVPALVAIVVAFGIGTHARNTVYASDISLWGDSLAKRPQNGRALLNLGLAHSRHQRYDEALEYLHRAEGISPKDPTIPGAIGQVLYRAGRIDESIAVLERGNAMEGASWYVRLNLGNSLLAAGRVEEAVEHLTYVQKEQPYHPDIEFNFANALAAAGRVAEALPHYAEAIRRDPQDLEARVNYAGVLRDAGRLDEALRAYEAGLKVHPQAFELYSNRGVAFAAKGRADLAIEDFSTAVRLAPESFEQRMNLIFALSDAGRFADALPHYEVVVAMRPPTADLCNAYGVALANAGRIADGLVWLRRAVELEPELREAQENLRAVEQAARATP